MEVQCFFAVIVDIWGVVTLDQSDDQRAENVAERHEKAGKLGQVTDSGDGSRFCLSGRPVRIPLRGLRLVRFVSRSGLRECAACDWGTTMRTKSRLGAELSATFFA